ncbi:MAG: LysR family transcriptional regulator, partial [Pseudomonadota bacterium]
MNWQAITFDWNQVRAFLATTEEGSLSAAARALKLTQPTLSRQVTALEEHLGVTLFERGPRTMALTDAGRELIDHVRLMGEAATRVSIAASGQSQTIAGRVAITCTNMVATHHLEPVIRLIRAQAPGIQLEIITSNDVRDLTRREADIAIRHGRPDQPELFAKKIGDTQAHLYASTSYLDSHGRPKTVDDLIGHDFVGFEVMDTMLPVLAELGLPTRAQDIKIITASGTALLAYVKAGFGISILTRDMANLAGNVEIVLPDFP